MYQNSKDFWESLLGTSDEGSRMNPQDPVVGFKNFNSNANNGLNTQLNPQTTNIGFEQDELPPIGYSEMPRSNLSDNQQNSTNFSQNIMVSNGQLENQVPSKNFILEENSKVAMQRIMQDLMREEQNFISSNEMAQPQIGFEKYGLPDFGYSQTSTSNSTNDHQNSTNSSQSSSDRREQFAIQSAPKSSVLEESSDVAVQRIMQDLMEEEPNFISSNEMAQPKIAHSMHAYNAEKIPPIIIKADRKHGIYSIERPPNYYTSPLRPELIFPTTSTDQSSSSTVVEAERPDSISVVTPPYVSGNTDSMPACQLEKIPHIIIKTDPEHGLYYVEGPPTYYNASLRPEMIFPSTSTSQSSSSSVRDAEGPYSVSGVTTPHVPENITPLNRPTLFPTTTTADYSNAPCSANQSNSSFAVRTEPSVGDNPTNGSANIAKAPKKCPLPTENVGSTSQPEETSTMGEPYTRSLSQVTEPNTAQYNERVSSKSWKVRPIQHGWPDYEVSFQETLFITYKMFLHAHECDKESCKSEVNGIQPNLVPRFCWKAKKILEHADNCDFEAMCTVVDCKRLRKFQNHFKSCLYKQCSVCKLLKMQFDLSRQMRICVRNNCSFCWTLIQLNENSCESLAHPLPEPEQKQVPSTISNGPEETHVPTTSTNADRLPSSEQTQVPTTNINADRLPVPEQKKVPTTSNNTDRLPEQKRIPTTTNTRNWHHAINSTERIVNFTTPRQPATTTTSPNHSNSLYRREMERTSNAFSGTAPDRPDNMAMTRQVLLLPTIRSNSSSNANQSSREQRSVSTYCGNPPYEVTNTEFRRTNEGNRTNVMRSCLQQNQETESGPSEKRKRLDKKPKIEEKKVKLEEPDSEVCKICMDAPMNTVFLECGHIVACINCAEQSKNCPICRLKISRVIKTFKA